MPTPTTLGSRVADRRIRLKLTQQQLAAKCGCAVSTISQIERLKRGRQVSQRLIEKLSEHLGISTDALVGMPRRARGA